MAGLRHLCFALVSIARLARLWHILFGAIYSVPFSHNLRAGSSNGFSTTEKVKPQDLIESAEVLLQRRQFLSHGHIKSRT
jgi:hypothetical protein